MASYTGHTIRDDSDFNSEGSTIVEAIYSNENLDPEVSEIGIVIGSSTVFESVINTATLWWYNESYSKTPRATTIYGNIQIWNGSGYDLIYEFTSEEPLGWNSHNLTSEEINSINSFSSNTQTVFKFTVGDPSNNPTIGASGYRRWGIRAMEYEPVGELSVKLVIDYTPSIVPPIITSIGNPHAIGIATRGIATVGNSTIGLTSKGYLVRIGESTYIPPIIPNIPEPSGASGGGSMGEYKRVIVTVYAYGEEFVTTHIVDKSTNVTIEDVGIVDNGETIVEVTIENLK